LNWRGLELVDAEVVHDPAAALKSEDSARRIIQGRAAVVVVVHNDHLLITAKDWRRLMEVVERRRRRGGRVSTAQIERLIAARGQHATVVAPGDQPTGPAVVKAGEKVVGAWIAPDGDAAEAPESSGGVMHEEAARPARSRGVSGFGDALFHWTFRRKRRRGRGVADDSGGAAQAGRDTASAPSSSDTRVEDSERVRRTPHIDVPDEPLESGQTVNVEVYTDMEAPRPGEVVEGISLKGDVIELYVWLLVSEHFGLDGEPVRPFRIDRSTARSASVEYEIRVSDDPPVGTHPSVAAVFFHEGRQAGKVERRVRVAGVAEGLPAAGRREPEPPGVGVERRPLKPDLTVAISRSGRDQSWECAVSTPHLDQYVRPVAEPWPFPRDAASMINQRMERFAEKGLSPLKRRARLVGAGKALYEDAPGLFAKVYAELVAEGKPLDTILIATEEATFPLELLVPDGGDRPLGARHALGRWTHPTQFPTKQRVAVRNGYVIAPDYPSEKRKLKHAAAEVQYVCETFNCHPVDPPSIERLNAALGDRPASLLHFVCHGAAPDGSYAQSLYLLQEVEGEFTEEELDDEMLLGLAGVAHGVKTGTPLVFLNACEAGRQIPSLMGTAGMAKAFITEGAICVIAPLWRVRDTLAAKIAVDIYEAAINAPVKPLADIVRDVRAQTYDETQAEDSYAAYCFFGDPHTRLERVSES
jgi:hypothetical protein